MSIYSCILLLDNNKIDDDEAFIQSIRQKASSLSVSYSSPAPFTGNTIKRNSIQTFQSGTNFGILLLL